jgi:hypothetical protein
MILKQLLAEKPTHYRMSTLPADALFGSLYGIG